MEEDDFCKPTKYEILKGLQEQIIDLLHDFNRQCLIEPYDGDPLKRKMRKEFFAIQILHHVRPYLNLNE